jgi:phenylacetate-CoA ligase
VIGSRWAQMARLAPLAITQPRFPYRDARAIERVQARRTARIVEYAYEHVPHYREEMDRLGARPGDVTGPSDLARLPVIEREQIQRDPDRFVSRARGVDRLELSSSGSSGTPIKTVWDRPSILAHTAYRERQRVVETSLLGRRFGYRQSVVSVGTGTGAKVYNARTKALWLPRSLIDRQYLSMQDGSAANVDELVRFDPHVIHSYGSYLESLFLELERRGLTLPSLKVAQFAGDAISEPARRRIEERFGIPAIGIYNAHETLDVAFECEERSGYHVSIDLCPVGIVDPNGRELPDGEVGEIVISNLVNRGTVLLNYRLGDLGAKLAGRCPCGRNLPLLHLAQGRLSPWISMDNGRRVHGMVIRDAVKNDADVRQFRLAQATGSRVEVSVVPQEDADRDALCRRLVESLSSTLGPGTTVDVRFVEHIPPGPSGRRQEIVVSHVASSDAEA